MFHDQYQVRHQNQDLKKVKRRKTILLNTNHRFQPRMNIQYDT